MAVKVVPKDEMVNAVGTVFEPGDWIDITQDRINTFADCNAFSQIISKTILPLHLSVSSFSRRTPELMPSRVWKSKSKSQRLRWMTWDPR